MNKVNYELEGRTFGRLTVLSKIPAKGKARWLCRCDCGTEKSVSQYELLVGDVKSCGKSHLPPRWVATYTSWRCMNSRCHIPTDKAFQRYGARGVSVCDAWREDFATFYSDMGPRPDGMTLDRIDGTKGYEPGNCRWATALEQQSNCRNNRYVEINGERLTIAQLSRASGVPYSTIFCRLQKGKPPL